MAKKKLNLKQKKAVEFGKGPLLIIAGAGTGKTTVITERIKHLILQKKAKPSEVLALTFTEKAALEMEERVDKVMPYGYTQMWISTFHAFCDQVLRQDGADIGLSSGYRLLTQAETVQFLRSHLFDLNLKYYRPRGNPNKFLADLLSHFNRLRDENVRPQEYLKWAKKKRQDSNLELEAKKKYLELARAFVKFQKLKEAEALVDFADLISYCLQLFEDKSNVLKDYQKKFKYILVDEFQDTNIAQNKLVSLLAGDDLNLTVVADDDQSIFRWRGAATSNVIQFKKQYPNSKVITLIDNYRSTQEILDSAYKLIQHNNPDRLEVKQEIDKRLVANRKKPGEAVKFIFTHRVENEAEAVVEKIKKLLKIKKYQYKDFAILVRANNHAHPFVQALKLHGLPFQFLGPGRLFQQEEVKDLIAYLKVLDNFEDSLSFYRVLSHSTFSLSGRTLAAVRNQANRENISLFEAAEKATEIETLPSQAQEKLLKIVKLVYQHLDQVPNQPPGQILYDFVNQSGWLSQLSNPKNEKDQTQAQNVAKFFDKLKTYESDHPQARIFDVVEWLDLKLELGESPLATDTDWNQVNAVNILTLHSAKGLEFPVVFLVNLVSQRFPTRNRSERIPVPDELIKEILPEGDSHLQEERRLFYVGLTRAQDQVFLTGSKFYGEGKRAKKISQFVFETLGKDFKPQKQVEKKSQLSIFNYQKQTPKQVKLKTKHQVKKLSYSRIEAFRRCPKQYYYQYILKLPTPVSHQQSFGISIHNAMRDLYKEVLQGKGVKDLPWKQVLKENWINLGYKNKTHEKKSWQQAKKFVQGYFKSELKKPKVVAVEEGFKVKVSQDLWVSGRIDRIDKVSKGQIEIVDYKTGKVMSQKEVDNSLQMTIYALAASSPATYNCQPGKLKLSFYFFEEQKKMTTTRTKKQLEKARKEILKIRNEIANSKFRPKPGYLCQWCDFQMLCPAAP